MLGRQRHRFCAVLVTRGAEHSPVLLRDSWLLSGVNSLLILKTREYMVDSSLVARFLFIPADLDDLH